MEPATLVGAIAALLTIVKLLGIVDRWAHALGMTKVMDAQLRHFAAIPGNKFAPVANAIADAVDAGKDLDLLSKVADTASVVQTSGAHTVTDVVKTVVTEAVGTGAHAPPFVNGPAQ